MSFTLVQTYAPAKLVVCLLFVQWWKERCLLSCAECIVCVLFKATYACAYVGYLSFVVYALYTGLKHYCGGQKGVLSCAVCILCAVQIRQRVSQILSIRGGSVKAIKSIMRGKTISSLQSFCTPATVLPVYLVIFPVDLWHKSQRTPVCTVCMIRSHSQEFHSIFISEADYLFSHRPQYTAYPLKLTTYTPPPAFRPIKLSLKI